ncbi:hypothetical protein J4729_15120 [Leisingera sp. HS039]|uniref:hypothetical protein n=1 Tax=unclassified Leisingera TaxID=2614906 RepID=UPI001070C63A|nr:MULTISPECIES: hypothetical protein [unclassified Leisingera]MBQ4825872.1 hypothetical protein [Leisingera sp. HS039]QBR34975.1 hypothetical protein ETW23_01175 [Leisingera sp. NJS201]
MSLPQTDISPLAGQLEHTLSAGQLPTEFSGWGSQLLRRLRQPVQIIVTGVTGSGKSALIDMLLGRVVIGRNAGSAVIDICYGDQECAVFESVKGERLQQAGVLADLDMPAGTLRIRQFLPDPRLRTHSYTELPLAGPQARQQNLLQQASGAADIILWCSQAFPDTEQALWAEIPDSTKDHSFLVLTMADRQIMRGTLDGLIKTVEPVAAEEFLGVYPVAAIQGLTARTAAAPAHDLWRSSGGKQLADGVMRQVETGRASDVDQAELLIRQFGGETAGPAGLQSAIPAAAPPLTAAAGLSSALDQMQARAEEMLAEAEAAGGPQAGPVLAQCMETIRGLSQTLAAMPGSTAVEAALEAAQDGEEMLMLCQLEQDEDAAIDAVTLLIQLKKELIEDTTE